MSSVYVVILGGRGLSESWKFEIILCPDFDAFRKDVRFLFFYIKGNLQVQCYSCFLEVNSTVFNEVSF